MSSVGCWRSLAAGIASQPGLAPHRGRVKPPRRPGGGAHVVGRAGGRSRPPTPTDPTLSPIAPSTPLLACRPSPTASAAAAAAACRFSCPASLARLRPAPRAATGARPRRTKPVATGHRRAASTPPRTASASASATGPATRSAVALAAATGAMADVAEATGATSVGGAGAGVHTARERSVACLPAQRRPIRRRADYRSTLVCALLPQGGPVLEDRPPPPKPVEPNFQASGCV